MMSNSQRKVCRYCGGVYQKDSEHVFPYGLGGEDILMNCVCEQCNNDFSSLEEELYQKSPIALMRSVEGLTGYKRGSKGKLAPFKAPLLLTFDEKNKIAYEVGQYHTMKTFMRPQVISIAGQFYVEGETIEGLNELSALFVKWKQSNLKVVTRFPQIKGGAVFFTEFIKDEDHFKPVNKEENLKVKKEIIVDIMDNGHALFEFLTPRLFLNDEAALRIRAQTETEAVKFIGDLLNFTLTGKSLNSFSIEPLGETIIYVGFNFNPVKCERALAKIALNCLMHYFPESKSDSSINNCISYIRTGSPPVQATLTRGSMVLDANNNSHSVVFYQHSEALSITVRLFNGQFPFNVYIPKIHIMKINEYCRVIIDHKQRINRFENRMQFLSSE
jgi:hypothetical protein